MPRDLGQLVKLEHRFKSRHRFVPKIMGSEDEQMRSCPIGVPGETYWRTWAEPGLPPPGRSGGATIPGQPLRSRGRRPAVQDRRSWPLVRRRLLEHMGRLDFQIKLRGYRIEPGEIEAALTAHPQVLQAVVVGDDALGDTRLVAYVVPAPGQPRASQLRAHLRKSLPEYMLPQQIVFLSGLPLAANRKLDRAALPAPYLGGPEHLSFKAPCGKLEVAIADLWQELLGVERVGRYDNFFDLGGNSLLAMRLITRIESTTGCRITLLQLPRAACTPSPSTLRNL